MGLLCSGSLSTVGYTRVRSVSESESYFSLSSSFHTPTFLKSFYQGSLGSLASLSDSGSLKRWDGASVTDRSVSVSPGGAWGSSWCGRLLCTCLFLNPKSSCTLSSVKKNPFCNLLSLHVKIVGLCHVVTNEGCIVCMLVSLLTNDKQKHLSSILHQTAELSTNLYSYWEKCMLLCWIIQNNFIFLWFISSF